MLAILLQDTPENREALGSLDGIDILLQQLATYKRNDPASNEESEYMENLFNCVCSALLFGGNREKFVQGEGPQLMNLMIREKKQSRSSSLKVLNHAVSGPEGATNANKLVDILGLRTLFPLFMRTPKKNKRKGLSVREHEEHIVSILAALLQHVAGSTRTRILSKFEENDFEKVERLTELHFKYLEKLEKLDRNLAHQLTQGEQDEDEIYLKRLDAGLFTLQLVDYIILEVCIASTKVKERLLSIIGLRNGSLDKIKEIAREYGANLGDENQEWKQLQVENIDSLLEKF
jgi:beta-catenin-like protein 1